MTEFFSDADLLDHVSTMYGSGMADAMAYVFGQDPDNATGFCRSVRRSLTREIERAACGASASASSSSGGTE